jgi:hypothetical protein
MLERIERAVAPGFDPNVEQPPVDVQLHFLGRDVRDGPVDPDRPPLLDYRSRKRHIAALPARADLGAGLHRDPRVAAHRAIEVVGALDEEIAVRPGLRVDRRKEQIAHVEHGPRSDDDSAR